MLPQAHLLHVATHNAFEVFTDFYFLTSRGFRMPQVACNIEWLRVAQHTVDPFILDVVHSESFVCGLKRILCMLPHTPGFHNVLGVQGFQCFRSF